MLRNTYTFPRAATDAIIKMGTDPKIDDVSKLERKLQKGFDGGDILVYDMRVEIDGKQDVNLFFRCVRLCCWMHFQRRGLFSVF